MPTVYSTPAPAKIPSIDTIYKGYRFRSRLEARWAVFFDHLKLNWVYEHEGHALPSGWYLPDFYFPEDRMWIEIKPPVWSMPQETPAEHILARELADAHRDGIGFADVLVIVMYGDPRHAAKHQSFVHFGDTRPPKAISDPKNPLRSAAFDAARQARFEHGERP